MKKKKKDSFLLIYLNLISFFRVRSNEAIQSFGLKQNLLLNRHWSLLRKLIMMNQFGTKRSNFFQCIHRQQVKQLGHQTRSTTIYQKKRERKQMRCFCTCQQQRTIDKFHPIRMNWINDNKQVNR